MSVTGVLVALGILGIGFGTCVAIVLTRQGINNRRWWRAAAYPALFGAMLIFGALVGNLLFP